MAENRDTCLARKLDAIGVKHPNWTISLARKYKLDISLCAAVLMQESAGGHNVFGHDPVYPRAATFRDRLRVRWLNSIKGKRVTRGRYRRYRTYRKLGYGMQGVGPLQLTWYEFQNAADSAGGAWKPYVNMDVGFGVLARNIVGRGMEEGIERYNGSGPAARQYARSVLRRRAQIHDRLAGC